MAGQVPLGGYRQAPERPADHGAPPTVVCGSCGVGAPVRGTACEGCHQPLAETRRHVPASGSLVWCAVRAAFQCRSCAFHSPLDGVELDKGVHCAQCGAFQKFGTDGWEAMLALCHGVADLAGPTPEGRFPSERIWIGDANPHREIGVSLTFAKAGGGEDASGGALPEVEVGRGHPTCAACKQPVDVALRSGGCETRCRGCGATASYQVPPAIARWAPALRAIVAPEQRTDQRAVKLQQQGGGGVVALLCPQCGAPLPGVRAGSVRCSHCNTSSFVPARARPREDGSLVEPDPFFIAFQGASAERERLEMPRLPSDEAMAGKAKGLFTRGLAPLKGVELPEKKGGVDLRQLGLTLGLTAVALTIGFLLIALYNSVIGL
jgi:hypothetical protein